MWILGGLFSKNPTMMYTVGDSKNASGQQDTEPQMMPNYKTYEQYLEEHGGVDPYAAAHEKNVETVKAIMEEGNPKEIDASVKCCGTCQFWDGQRSITSENNVEVPNGRTCGNCTNPECATKVRRGSTNLWWCNTCPGTSVPKKSFYRKWDQI